MLWVNIPLPIFLSKGMILNWLRLWIQLPICKKQKQMWELHAKNDQRISKLLLAEGNTRPHWKVKWFTQTKKVESGKNKLTLCANHCSVPVVLWPSTLASPGNSLPLQNTGAPSRTTESQTQQLGPSNLFQRALQVIQMFPSVSEPLF